MTRYYYFNGNDQTGPFTLAELQQRRIHATDFIWHDELSDWCRACDVPELTDLVVGPPPVPKSIRPPILPSASQHSSTSKVPILTSEKGSLNSYRFFIVGGAVAVLLALAALYTYRLANQDGIISQDAVREPKHNNGTVSATTVSKSATNQLSITALTDTEAEQQAIKQFNVYKPKLLAANPGSIVGNVQTFLGDLSGDGQADIVLSFVLMPSEGGNMIIGGGIALYVNKRNRIEVVTGLEPDYHFAVEAVRNNKIYVNEYANAAEEPPCCPTVTRVRTYRLDGRQLVEENS